MAALQSAMTDEVRSRMMKAAQQIGEKYESGNAPVETSVDGPTGALYREKEAATRAARKQAKSDRLAAEAAEADEAELNRRLQDDEEDDEDYELRMLRDARLKEMKKSHEQKIENLGKGHGQLREVTQDEFLAEVTGSYRVICHFYHNDFPRCKIMDHHIQRLVSRHVETKFIKINAEKAPFFVEKLNVRTIPSLVLFFDGVVRGKVIGFDGLSDEMPAGKEDEWPTIKLARLLGSVGAIDEDAIVDDDQIEQNAKATYEDLRSRAIKEAMNNFDFDDDEFDDA